MKKSTNQSVVSEEYDLSYEGDPAVIPVCIILTIIWVIVLMVHIESSTYYMYSIPVRLLMARWAWVIASNKNRSPFTYAWLAFFLPVITLLMVNRLKKFKTHN